MENLGQGMEWLDWVWWVAAVLLLLIEILTGTLVFLFFAAAAVLTALVQLIFAPSLSVALVVFGVSGILLLVSLRGVLSRVFHRTRSGRLSDVEGGVDHPDRNQWAVVTQDLAPGASGQLEYQGSVWTGVHRGDRPVRAGEQVQIVRTHGIQLEFRNKE